MKYAVWIVQVLLAVVMAGAGIVKLMTPREELMQQMAWAQDFSQTSIWLIGAAEAAGAIGLIVPAATGILPILTPLAASGLSVLMIGAAYTHLRRSEPMIGPLVLATIAAVVAAYWFSRRRSHHR